MIWDSIDPGVRYFALARWQGTALVSVSMEPIPAPEAVRTMCVIEKPQVYRDSKVRNRDIEDLLFAAGMVAGRYPRHVAYLPAEWKGQVPKTVHHLRIMAALQENERALLKALPKGQLKHIVDAVGIGLYHLTRTGAKR